MVERKERKKAALVALDAFGPEPYAHAPSCFGLARRRPHSNSGVVVRVRRGNGGADKLCRMFVGPEAIVYFHFYGVRSPEA